MANGIRVSNLEEIHVVKDDDFLILNFSDLNTQKISFASFKQAFPVAVYSVNGQTGVVNLDAHDVGTYNYSEIDGLLDAKLNVTYPNIDLWDQAFGWGNHADYGYLTEEVDPFFNASPASTITDEDIARWNDAYDAGGNVQSDWNIVDINNPAFIRNKPTIPVVPVTSVNGKIGDVVLSFTDVGAAPNGHNHDNLYAPKVHNHDSDYVRLDDAPNRQVDWLENNLSSPFFIRNKPTIPVVDYPILTVCGVPPNTTTKDVDLTFTDVDIRANGPTDWDTAFSWGNHANVGYLTQIDLINSQADWNVINAGDVRYIHNKPVRLGQFDNNTSTDGTGSDFYVSYEYFKANLISDWNQADPLAPDFIKNKPNISSSFDENDVFLRSVHGFDDIQDIYAPSPSDNQYLRYNAGNSRWEAVDVDLSGVLVFMGTVDATLQSAPVNVENGWVFIQVTNTGAVVDGSWNPLASVEEGDRLLYSTATGWSVIGNVNTGGASSSFSVINNPYVQGQEAKLEYDANSALFTFTPGDNSLFLTSYNETDPVFSASTAAEITPTHKNNWNAAFGWGDHSAAGYVETETDPVFTASPAGGITDEQIADWGTAYIWGDHSAAGYVETETDPVFSASPAGGISTNDISYWNMAYGWGNHANEGYLKSQLQVDWTEADNSRSTFIKNKPSTIVTSVNGKSGATTLTASDVGAMPHDIDSLPELS